MTGHNKFRGLLLAAVVLLGAVTAFFIDKKGETLRVIDGRIQRCEYLGGGGAEAVPHATIKTEQGRYLIMPIEPCTPGTSVKVFVNRGVFYFNTVYAPRPG